MPAIESERCTSADSALIWLAASVEAVTSVLCASRAPAVIDSAVAVPAIDSERCTSAVSVLTWLAASEEAVTSVVCTSRAPARIEAAVAEPAADSVRSTSAASALIWLAASPEAATRVDCASRALVRIEFAAPVPTAVSARSTSAEVSLSWAPTSEETVISDCCAVRAPVWMVSLVLTTRLVSERSASSTCELIAVEIISARDIMSSLAWRPLLSMRPATASTREPSRSSNCATRMSMSLATEPTLVSMAWWMSWKRAVTVSVRCVLRPSMVSVDAGDAAVDRLDRLRVPSVSVEVRRVRRVSIDCTACEAPLVKRSSGR